MVLKSKSTPDFCVSLSEQISPCSSVVCEQLWWFLFWSGSPSILFGRRRNMRKLKALPSLKRWTMWILLWWFNREVLHLNFNFLNQHLSIASRLLALCLQDVKIVFRKEILFCFFFFLIPLKFFVFCICITKSSDRTNVIYCDPSSMINGVEPSDLIYFWHFCLWFWGECFLPLYWFLS